MIERSQKLVGIKDKKIISKYIGKHISTEKYTNVHYRNRRKCRERVNITVYRKNPMNLLNVDRDTVKSQKLPQSTQYTGKQK